MRPTLLGLCLSLAVIPAFGQTFGEITGHVKDASGALVAGAAVVATNPATGTTRSAATNAAGVYSFPSLQPGAYNLRVTMTGFRTVTRDDVELQVQQTARIDFALEVGQVTEILEVKANASLLDTENATVGTVIENRRILELPLNGRNFLQMVALSPNVSFSFGGSVAANRQGGQRSSTNISIAGQRAQFNHYTLDGVENTNVEANTFTFLPSIEALQEFKVQTGVYAAEFGRAPSQINVSTKPGTNAFHGTLFEFLRNDKLDAKAYAFTAFRPAKDPFKWNQYGFYLGGPVLIPKLFNGRNRLFFSTNFEGFRDRKQLRIQGNVPSAAMRGGNFSEVRTPIFDPLTRAGQSGAITASPFAGNIIPSNRLHSTSVKLLEFYPAANQPGPLVSNYQAGGGRKLDRDQFNQRIDFAESTQSNWFGRYSTGDESQLLPGLKLNGLKILNNPWQAMISNTRILSPTLVNEFRFAANRFTNDFANELAFQRDVINELKIPGVLPQPPEAWGTPNVVMTGLSSFGSPPDGWTTRAITFQWVDNISWVRGKHSLRFGAELRRDRWNASGYNFPRGQFSFEGVVTQNPSAPAGTGYGFGDYMLGYCRLCRAGITQAFAKFRATSQAYYIDDSWKVLPNLTVSLGLRYENTPPWFDASGKFINGDIPFYETTSNVQDLKRHPVMVRIGKGDFYEGVSLRFNPAVQVARDGRMGERTVETDHNDFAPRLGIAWSPSANWTVRTGAGVFYTQDTGTPKFDPARNLAGYRLENANTDFPDLTWDRPFTGQLTGTVQVNSPALLALKRFRRTPYVIQYLLNVQRSLSRDTFVEVGYLGSVGRKLEQFRNFNIPEPSAIGSLASRLPYPEFGSVFIVDGMGKSNYNSLALKMQRRFSGGLTFLAGYTWSKSMDTGSGIRPQGVETLFPQNELCVHCDWARSAFHTNQRLVMSTIYDLPFGKGAKRLNRGGLVNALAGGWQLGSIITMQTGFPLNVYAGRDQSNTGHLTGDRVNATGQPTDLPGDQRDPQRFFNTGAYVFQPYGSYGTSGRNTVTGPGMLGWDFSTIKNFLIREGHRLEFRFEAFNFPNHPIFGEPSVTFTAATFGQIVSTRIDMRQLQFGLKYMF